MNCILTPILTPPLDTEIGGERPTVQLISVKITENGCEFGFDLLDRWIKTAGECGIKYFEISHLFSQWGAEFAPKVVAEKNGETVRIFGWDTPGTGSEYTAFVSQLLPALISRLKALGVIDRCIFHISDEPNLEQFDGYVNAKNVVAPFLEGLKVADALSSVEFYKKGAVALPIPSNDHIEAFIEAGVSERWTYYCCGQWDRGRQPLHRLPVVEKPHSRGPALQVRHPRLPPVGLQLLVQHGFAQADKSLHLPVG